MPGTSAKRTCFACPAQWEGKTTDGKDFFARYRHGMWRIDLDGQTVAEGMTDDGLGICSFDEIKAWASAAGVEIDGVEDLELEFDR